MHLKPDSNYNVVILFSGGADSIFLHQLSKSLNYKSILLFINYGQKHIKELQFAQKYANEENVDIFYTDFITYSSITNSALTGNFDNNLYKNVNEFYVPMRNTFLLTIATAYAETNKIPLVWIGSNYSDRMDLFPDCYQEYIVNIDKLFSSICTFSIKIEAPLLGMSKEMILNLLKKEYNITEDRMFSGYLE